MADARHGRELLVYFSLYCLTDTDSAQYAFLTTRRGQFDSADDLLRHLLYAVVYQKQKYQDIIRLTLASGSLQCSKKPRYA